MLQPIPVGLRNFTEYHPLIEPAKLEKIYRLAKKLEGKRILHVNSNSARGGVAEILSSAIPLMRDIGINAHWYSLTNVPASFYRLTKAFHHGLQGDSRNL